MLKLSISCHKKRVRTFWFVPVTLSHILWPSYMYTPTNKERADGLRKWAETLTSNPENSHMPSRYLKGIRRRAEAEADLIELQPDEACDEFGTEDGIVSESFMDLLAQPTEED